MATAPGEKSKRGGARPGAGRKLLLTPKVAEKILEGVRGGNYLETACAKAGIDASTMREWFRKGAAGLEPYATFSKDMVAAEAEAEATHVLKITSASKEDWRAAAWILSRKYHKRWGDKIQVEIERTWEKALSIIEEELSSVCGDEVTDRVLAALIRRFGGEETPGEAPATRGSAGVDGAS